jgi:hypothetical protein
MSKMILAAAVAAAVFVPRVQAADTSNFALSSDHRITMALHPSQVNEQYAIAHPAGVRPVYSNIGYEYPKGRYISNSGWTISGPTSLIGEQVWIGAQFTPKNSTTLVEADVAVGYVTGTMGFVLNLYTDAGGVPGTLMATFKAKKMPTFGSCCALTRVFNGTGVPVTGGTPYWLTVETNAATADEWAAWNDNDVDQVDFGTNAVNNGAGWAATQLLPGPSFAVFGG